MRLVTSRSFIVLLAGILSGLIAVLVYSSSATAAANLPKNFKQFKVAGGFSDPTAMAVASGGRILVAEQGGKLRVIKKGKLLRKPFARFDVDSRGERGLLGVAVDPNFKKNRYVYVYLTSKRGATHNRVVRLKSRGDRAGAKRKVILRLNNLGRAKNHNGGAIHFGKDRKLYIAVGDNAEKTNAQTLKNLHGKILRINRSGSIPETNPFYKKAKGKNRAIWARGLRNPYSFAVQPRSGRMHINDVGQKTWEEINVGVRGANYGWPRYEGPERNRKFRSPIYAYRHGSGATTGCAITGGTFYNPRKTKFPRGYVGDYFFADFCSGWIRKLDSRTRKVTSFASGLSYPVDLKVRGNGDLLYLERGSGSVYGIRHGR